MGGGGYAQRGSQDSRALSQDPLEVRREEQGTVSAGLEGPESQRKTSIASPGPRAAGWDCLTGNLISNLGNLPAAAR